MYDSISVTFYFNYNTSRLDKLFKFKWYLLLLLQS